MTNKNETPSTWEQQRELLLFAQILTQSHQITLVLENIQMMVEEIKKVQDTWDKVEHRLVKKQDS